MWTTLIQAYDLLGRDNRSRWVLLILLAMVVSSLEIIGAVLVYTLLALVVDPGGAVDLPWIGDVRSLFPDADSQALMLGIVVTMAAFFLIRGVVKIGATYAQVRLAHNAGARLSVRLIKGYLRWPYAVHLERSSAELIRNGHQAVIATVDQVLLPVILVVGETVVVVGLLAVLIVLAPVATGLAVLVMGGAVALLLLVVQPRLQQLGRIHHAEARGTLSALQQALHGLRDIKILGREAFFAKVYGASRMRMARANYLRATAAQLPKVVIETSLLGFILLFFALILIRGTDSQSALSVLGLFGYAGLRLQPSLQHIVAGFNNLKFAAAPLEDLHADLKAIEQTEAPGPEPSPLPFRHTLDMEGVSFQYAGTDSPALRDINLSIAAGEQIGIAGPTGGGKTTLVDILSGLLEPNSGRITVDGSDLVENARAWQRNLGVVPQMVFLIDDSLRRNIALGIVDHEIDEVAVLNAVKMAQLEEFIESLPEGLDTVVGERGVRISGGQRQRIAIARSLYRKPSVLIFDEGTSALDNATESHLMDAIQLLRGHRTVILIAHRLSTVRSCDRIVFVEHGRVTGLGTYEELARNHASFQTMIEAVK